MEVQTQRGKIVDWSRSKDRRHRERGYSGPVRSHTMSHFHDLCIRNRSFSVAPLNGGVSQRGTGYWEGLSEA